MKGNERVEKEHRLSTPQDDATIVVATDNIGVVVSRCLISNLQHTHTNTYKIINILINKHKYSFKYIHALHLSINAL